MTNVRFNKEFDHLNETEHHTLVIELQQGDNSELASSSVLTAELFQLPWNDTQPAFAVLLPDVRKNIYIFFIISFFTGIMFKHSPQCGAVGEAPFWRP